jgi:hypothetical protein
MNSMKQILKNRDFMTEIAMKSEPHTQSRPGQNTLKQALPEVWLTRLQRCFSLSFSKVTFLAGRAVDARLSALGALAQAVDHKTVLLSSLVFQLPLVNRFRLVTHEMAHTIQLRQVGKDDLALLEEEAWEAAEYALHGLPFAIRGKGVHPMCAVGFTDDTELKFAYPYYNKNNKVGYEPVSDKSVVKVTPVYPLKNMNVVSLFNKIANKCTKGDDVLIACHSATNGVAIPLATGTDIFFSENVALEMTKTLRNTKKITANEKTIKASAKILSISPDTAAQLYKAAKKVREKGINKVHFRGCNLGQWRLTLMRFKDLLNCNDITAVDLYSQFSRWKPRFLKGGTLLWRRKTFDSNFKTFERKLKKGGVIKSGKAPNRFFYFTVGSGQNIGVQQLAESLAGAQQWFARNLPRTKSRYDGNKRFPLHFLISGKRIIFPYRNGKINPAYASHIKQAKDKVLNGLF